ncbi:MAG: hypothetical protein LJE75_11675, partial [Gammaproteobacteria bacterium]|nr:hypothetical protein [Gammaproteobacteria bacterium]
SPHLRYAALQHLTAVAITAGNIANLKHACASNHKKKIRTYALVNPCHISPLMVTDLAAKL